MGLIWVLWAFTVSNVFEAKSCHDSMASLAEFVDEGSVAENDHSEASADHPSFIALRDFLAEFSESASEDEVRSASIGLVVHLSGSNLGLKGILELGRALMETDYDAPLVQLSRIPEYPDWVADIFEEEFFGFLFSVLSMGEFRNTEDPDEIFGVLRFIVSIPPYISQLEEFGLRAAAEEFVISFIRNEAASLSRQDAAALMVAAASLQSILSSDAIALYAGFDEGIRGMVARKILENEDMQPLIQIESVESVLYELSMRSLSPWKRRLYTFSSFMRPVVRSLSLAVLVNGDILTSLAMDQIHRQLERAKPLESWLIQFLEDRGSESLEAVDTLMWVQTFHPISSVRAAATKVINKIMGSSES